MPTTARSWNSARCRGAGVRSAAADAGGDGVDEVLDARPRRVEVHPRAGDALLEQAPSALARSRRHRACGWRRREPTPCRTTPCRPGRRCRAAGRRGSRRCRRTTSRSSRWRLPPRARARRRAGDARRRRPRRARLRSPAAAAHSSTAENCGRPTPVIIRVVHMAPGPTPTLTMSAPASTRSRVPSAVTTLPATIGIRRPVAAACSSRSPDDDGSTSSIFSWWPCAVSTTSTSRADRRAARPPCRATSPLMPTAAPTMQPPVGIEGGRVDGGAQGPGAGDHTDAAGRRRRPAPCRGGCPASSSNIFAGVDAGVEGQDVARHHRRAPGRSGRRLGRRARSSRRPARPSPRPRRRRRARASGSATGPRRRSCPGSTVIGVSKTGWAALTWLDRPADDVERDVLRDGRDAAAAGDRLGHPAAGDGRHVRDGERQRGADAVGRGQVDVEARCDRSTAAGP